MPVGGIKIDIGLFGASFAPVMALLTNMDTSLTSIDTSLKGKFLNT